MKYLKQVQVSVDVVLIVERNFVKSEMEMKLTGIVSSALVARVINKEALDEYTRFDIQVTNVFKRSRADRVRRGGDQLWVRNEDLNCKCPDIKVGK